LSSLSVILIGIVGWRESYAIIGGFGTTAGLLLLITMREPRRGRFEIKNINLEPAVKITFC
jgi:predicted MFS family arabinose efflux permease